MLPFGLTVQAQVRSPYAQTMASSWGTNGSILAVDAWRFAYLHLPKTAGSSIGHALQRVGNVTACKTVTGNIPLCLCVGARKGLYQPAAVCHTRDKWLPQSRVAVMEQSFTDASQAVNLSAPGTRWLWLAAMRQPEDWFYSAIGHWCSHYGKVASATDRAGCHPNVTMQTLLHAGWLGRQRPKPYYFQPSLQSRMLTDFFTGEHWLFCDFSQQALLWQVVAQAIGSHGPVPHVNVAKWTHLTRFRARVPWSEVQRYFLEDEALHSRVKGTCFARTADPQLKMSIEAAALEVAANITWQFGTRHFVHTNTHPAV
jgi:hypothetical protein